jgi:hypothetical protein
MLSWAGQPKTTLSYESWDWGAEWVTDPNRQYYFGSRQRGLRLAVAVFDDGRDREHRLRFVTELSKQPAMRYRWFRALMLELKR